VRCRFTPDGPASAPGPGTAFLNGSTLTRFNIQQDGGPVYGLLTIAPRTDTRGDVRARVPATADG